MGVDITMINQFFLNPVAQKKGLDLTTAKNVARADNIVNNILAATKRTKNPVYQGLIDLEIITTTSDMIIIVSTELPECTNAWRQSFGKMFANDGLVQYCFVDKKGQRHFFNN